MPALHDRIAVVTGAAHGIGRGIARRFATEGAQVVLADLDADAGEEVAAGIRATGGRAWFVACDVADSASMERLIDAAVAGCGALHILVNNAFRKGPDGALETMAATEFARALQGNLYAALAAMQRAFPTMHAQRYGRIVNVCSLTGINAHPRSADYNVAKEALRSLSRSAAREWAGHGITVNVICPVARTAGYDRWAAEKPAVAASILRQNPMGRMGDPEADIAPAAAFLASGEARYITGNTLFVDGGSHINGVNFAAAAQGSD